MCDTASGGDEVRAVGEDQMAAATEDEDANQSNANVADNVDKSSQPTSPSAMTPLAQDTAADTSADRTCYSRVI